MSSQDSGEEAIRFAVGSIGTGSMPPSGASHGCASQISACQVSPPKNSP